MSVISDEVGSSFRSVYKSAFCYRFIVIVSSRFLLYTGLMHLCVISDASMEAFGVPCGLNAWAFVLYLGLAFVLCFSSPFLVPLEMPAVRSRTCCVMATTLYLRLRITSQFTCQAAPKIRPTLLIGTKK